MARIQSKFTMPVESSVHGAQAPGPGEFCPKTRLQARGPSSQQWTVLRHPILASFGPELTVEAIIDAGPGDFGQNPVQIHDARRDECPRCSGTWPWGVLSQNQATGTGSVESTVDSAQAPDPGEFWARVDRRGNHRRWAWGFWPESSTNSRCPSRRVSTVLRHLALGSFVPKPGYRHGVRLVNSGQCSGTRSW